MRDLADEFLNIYVEDLIKVLSPVGYPSASTIALTTNSSRDCGSKDNMWALIDKLPQRHVLVDYIDQILIPLHPDLRIALVYECYYRKRPGPGGEKMSQVNIADELQINVNTFKKRLKLGRGAMVRTLIWHQKANDAVRGTRYGASIGVV